jgi:DNA-binding transcriptional LysR family regulator
MREMRVGGADLNLLVALQALLEEANVTRAGDRVGMSQPAMSAALSRLRRRYNDELLVKVGRDLELTPLARALLPQVQQTMPLVEQALGLDKRFEPHRTTRSFSIACSDYAMLVLAPALRRRLQDDAPDLRVDYRPLPTDLIRRPLVILDADMFVGPRGSGFEGRSVDAFHDRFVCVVDPGNSRLVDGRLTADDLRELPWARAVLGPDQLNVVERRMAEVGFDYRSGVTARGWLPLSFVVQGTDLVALMPERLARRIAPLAGVVVVEPPFDDIALPEALWWHPSRDHDPGHRWLRAVVTQVAESL